MLNANTVNNSPVLTEKWIKASILGTIWASSEIILGSFLHNLKVPFSGNILTAIALVILISAGYKWREKGLYWRAGLICALLKTMSPSAVIFGPMIAIFAESVLLEISVRLLGKTIAGFILGSVLAMSWNLFQKIFNYIIFYGYNIIEVYTNLMHYAENQFSLKFNAVWAPLVLLLFLYALFGMISGIVGIRTGKKLDSSLVEAMNFNTANSANLQKQNNFKYSVLWLIVNLTVIAALLILTDRIGFYYWIALISVVAVIWALRYKRALRQIARPGLWISFAVITMLTAFVFSRLQSDSFSVKDAILIGLEMNFRAILLIMGFTVLGTELYNPKIRIFFANSYFKQLPVALEMSLDSLPAMIANMPNVKIMFKNPSMVVSHLFSYAEYRLEELRKGNRRKIYIITGQIGSGKTTLLNEFVQKAKSENIPVSGIISTRIIENNQTIGYDVVNISNGKTAKFLRKTGNRDQQMVGKYFIYTEGLKTGYEALQNDKTELVVVDEIGKLELDEKGWFEPVVQFMQNPGKYMILSVREEVIDAVISKFGITPEIILNTRENEFDLFDVIYKGKVRITEKQSILSSE